MTSLTAYHIKYEDPDEPSITRTAATRFDPDAAITALNNVRQQYRGIVFWLEPEIPEEKSNESASVCRVVSGD